MSAARVAALYVDPHGVYSNLPDVDVWDEARDARLYAGPWPVVAHPPCARWSVPLCYVNQTRYGLKVGDDGGCFASALAAVREFGGVLEHPRDTVAFRMFGLPRPRRGGWVASFDDPGVSTVVDQWAYGHRCKKETWIYYVGPEPPVLDWRVAPEGLPLVSWLNPQLGRERITKREASATPPAFRDVLLAMARSAAVTRNERRRPPPGSRTWLAQASPRGLQFPLADRPRRESATRHPLSLPRSLVRWSLCSGAVMELAKGG